MTDAMTKQEEEAWAQMAGADNARAATEGEPEPESEGGEAEPVPEGERESSEEGKGRPRFVPHAALHEERENRKRLEADNRKLLEERALFQGRLDAIMQMQRQPQAEERKEADPEPDPTVVVEKWQEKQQQDAQQKGPMQEQMQQLQMMIAQTKAQLQAAQATLAQAQAAKIGGEAGMPGTPGGDEIALEHQREMARMQGDQDTERLRAAAQLTAAREETQSRADTERLRIAADLKARREEMISERGWKEHDTAVDALTKRHDAGLDAATKIATAHIAADAQEKIARRQRDGGSASQRR